jgi:alcohol dehydrogenase, propanol-preferring
MGARVEMPWLGATCGVCLCCCDGRENLYDKPQLTG